MDPLLNFFSDLMTIVFGSLTLLAVVVVFLLLVIEVIDNIREGKSTTLDEDEEEY